MKKNWTFLTFCCGLFAVQCFAQINYTANERVRPFVEDFGYGANMGYYPPWQDEQLAEIAIGIPEKGIPGAGVQTIRPALFAHFLEYYGYDIRLPAFQYYQKIGMKNVVAFIGYPSDKQRDTKEYCPGQRSALFANLYTDIWDDGANGTPVNDKNDYALYLYEMVTRYKDYIKIWEIWNEPDFDYSGKAWKPKTIPDNWWEANPDPCDYAIRAPVFHYIRMLRISWEVIKTLDPDSYVAVGGLGFPSFMDAILRNTDNPEEGVSSKDYPLRGGAYFDMMSFHSYPHIDGSLRDWSDDVGGFVYQRHSDAAVEGMLSRKDEFGSTLAKYGYDGNTYPEKIYILTECNIPRKAYQDFIGTEESQCNFIVKALVAAQKNDIHQFHIYNMGELTSYENAKNEYDLMGLYQKLEGLPPYQQQINAVGQAYKTTSDFLSSYRYHPQRTAALQLSPNINGAAFQGKQGEFRYVLWAKTQQDQSEEASASYTFPASWKLEGLHLHRWAFSANGQQTFQKGNNVQLSGSPVFIRPGKEKNTGNNEIIFNCTPNPFVDTLSLSIFLPQKAKVNLSIWDSQGKRIHSFAADKTWKAGHHQLAFTKPLIPGLYICRLETEDRTLIRRLVKVE